MLRPASPRVPFSLSTLAVLAGALTLSVACSSGGGGGQTVASTSIGPAGGQVQSADGIATLIIPAGALGTTQAITITTLGPGDLMPGMQALAPDNAYRFEPDGLQFLMPATLSFDLGPPDTSVAGQFTINLPEAGTESAGVIEELESGVIDVDSMGVTYTAPITHFSDYGVSKGKATNAVAQVSFPETLAPGETGFFSFSFVEGMNTTFTSWTVSIPDLTTLPGSFDPFARLTDLQAVCITPGVASTVVTADYDSTLYFKTVHPKIVLHLDTTCTGTPPGGISQNTLIDLGKKGFTEPEAMCEDEWCTPGQLLVWIAAAEGVVLIDPTTDTVVDSVPTSSAASDAVPVKNSEPLAPGLAPERGIIANGPGLGAAFRFDGATCALFPGLFLVDNHEDITQVAQDASLGAVGASTFGRVSLYGIDPVLGGFSFGTLQVPTLLSTVVSNAAKDHLLGVTKFPRQLVLLDPSTSPATETFVADLGTNPRRMRWDPTSGLGAISDFMDGTLTIFHWDGTATLPTILGTAAVGSGPVGIDVFGNLIVCAGFNDDTFSLVTVDLAMVTITGTTTLPIPFTSPNGGALQPGHAFFLRDANNTLGFSLFAADAVAFLPFAF